MKCYAVTEYHELILLFITEGDTVAHWLLYSEVHMCSHRHVIASSCAISLQSSSDEIHGKFHHCLLHSRVRFLSDYSFYF